MAAMAVASTSEHVFPEVERVIYGKAPLIEVVCQVRFPADLRIETSPPADFQQSVRNTFPLLNQKSQSVSLPAGLPSEVVKALQAAGAPTSSGTIWQFATEDGKQKLELTKDILTLVSTDYKRWEDYYGAYELALQSLIDLYKPPFLTRIGLRYRDLINRSKLNLDDVSWSELLQPYVLGELAEEGVGARVIQAARDLLLRLPERDAQVRLQHGFAEAKGENEEGYLIDCDFFIGRTETEHGHDAIKYLHEHAARYFRWCITERLHRAMEPKPLSER